MLSSLGPSLGLAVDPVVSLGIAAVYLILLAFVLLRARIHFRAIPELPRATTTTTLPDCMVVIPARDEEHTIGRAVRSLPPDSVIVVDDLSSDNTAREARQAGAGVLSIPDLPRGALGKPYACQLGANTITTRWILFADADTWYEPGFLASAVAAAEAASADFVSFHLSFAPQGLVENILVPYAAALFYAGVDPRADPAAAFEARCVLVRREAYQFVGGHGSLLSHPVEDVKLAMLAQRHRMKMVLMRTANMGHARLHAGWTGLWRGIRRNALRFTLVSSWRGGALLACALTSALWLPVASFLALAHQPVAAGVVAAAPALFLAAWYRDGRALLAPLAAYLILPILFNATLKALLGAHAQWKDRDV